MIVVSFAASLIWWVAHKLATWRFYRKGRDKNIGFVARALSFIPDDQVA
jgi:hypothetical protein